MIASRVDQAGVDVRYGLPPASDVARLRANRQVRILAVVHIGQRIGWRHLAPAVVHAQFVVPFVDAPPYPDAKARLAGVDAYAAIALALRPAADMVVHPGEKIGDVRALRLRVVYGDHGRLVGFGVNRPRCGPFPCAVVVFREDQRQAADAAMLEEVVRLPAVAGRRRRVVLTLLPTS